MFKKSIILSCLLIFYFCSSAQLFTNYNFKFNTYTTANGLVHNNIKKCVSDSKGFLWIISENGLSRYDGFQFKNFQHIIGDTNSLPANFLLDIAIDDKDRIYLAYKFGCCYFNDATSTFKRILNNKSDVKAEHIAYSLEFKQLFIVSENGLLKLDVDKNIFLKTSLSKPINFNMEIMSLSLDTKNNAWICIGRKGYYKYDIAKDTAHYFGVNHWPMSIYEDEDSYYISTWGNGFQRFDGKNLPVEKDKLFKFETDKGNFNNIFIAATKNEKLTGNDILWIATNTSGIGLYSKSQHKFVKKYRYDAAQKNGIATDFNWYIYTAPDGTLWICTWQGLMKVNVASQQFENAEVPELSGDLYNCISGMVDDPYDKNIAWMSINGSGIYKYSKKDNRVLNKYYNVADDYENSKWYNEIWEIALYKDSNNILWSPTYSGFIKIKNSIVSLSKVNSNGKLIYPISSFQDSKGHIWLAGSFVFEFNPYTQKNTVWNVPFDEKKGGYQFSGICEHANGDMFIGTLDGLYRLNVTTKSITKIDYWKGKEDAEIWKNIKSISCIGDKLYIGTFKGLAEFDINTNTTKIIRQERGLNHIGYTALFKAKDNNLWVYSSSGLFKYQPATGNLSMYTTADGIYNLSEDPSLFFNYNEKVYLGYRMAYTRFDAIQVSNNFSIPVPYITATAIKKFSENLNTTKFVNEVLSLSYKQNSIDFYFTALEYNYPEKLTFSYTLEGFDKEWSIPNTIRTKNYTNLSAGKYTFKVKAYNSNGMMSSKTADFQFKIVPAFWQTWWFKFLCILIFMALLFLFTQRRIADIRKKEAEKTAVNKMMGELETKLMRSQMNPHFIFNSLNSIQKYIWENKEEAAAEYLSNFAKLIRAILENSKKDFITLQEEVHILKLYIDLEQRRSNNRFDYVIRVSNEIDKENILIPPMLLQPFIENAIWHGLNKKEERGNLLVQIEKNESNLVFTIDDDGVGRVARTITLNDNKKSLGIEITKQRISLLLNKTDVQDNLMVIDKMANEKPIGTTILITLPIKYLHA